MSFIIRISSALTLAILWFMTGAFAQEIDSRGTDFWLAFMPNFHNNFEFGPETLEDSLYIFIAATEPVSGKIEYYDQFGAPHVRNFRILDPRQVYIFSLQFYDYEVRGYNRSGERTTQHDEGKVSKLSFHVTSDKDISVYGHSQANTTSEAFLVIPTDALGREYYAMSYYSDGTYSPGSGMGDHRTPSQILIVGTEDNTRVTISPSVRTNTHGSKPHDITLNRGETYLEQAYIDNNNESLDLTGSYIKSDKPVALFGGHQRCRVPISWGNSRDCLIEQMPPVSTWGTNAALVPFVKPIDDPSSVEDRYRVLAANDGTEVTLPNNEKIVLNAGKFVERNLSLTQGSYITATKPILVTQYKRTSGGGMSNSVNGDPLMMIIPPVEQFNDFYRIINVQAYEWGSEVYMYQYITVVGTKSIMGKLVIDGVKVADDAFNPITNSSDYVYAHTQVGDGAHTVTADGERFGIYVYGYGRANSYGYYGGMNLIKFDPYPPQLQADIDCFEVRGVMSDSSEGDKGLDTVFFDPLKSENVDISINSKTEKSVRFTARLVDIYQDGEFTVEARDKSTRETVSSIEIPGFTFSTTGTKDFKTLDFIDTLAAGDRICVDIPITNYGKHKQTLTRLGMKAGLPGSTFDGLPLELGPGETGTLRYCFGSNETMHYLDTIRIGTDCAMRTFATLDYLIAKDTLPPQSLVVDDPCLKNIKAYITENFKFDKGIKSYSIKAENMEYHVDSVSVKLITFTVGIIDPMLDASLEITSVDSVGNSVVRTISYPGFTLSFSSHSGEALDFGDRKIGAYSCDSIYITNYGKYLITLPDIYVYGNVRFSVPQSQMPLRIAPNETLALGVCYLPREADGDRDFDSLRISMNCVDRIVRLLGEPTPIRYVIPGICSLEVEATSGEYRERGVSFSVRALPSGEAFTGEIVSPGGSFDLEIYSASGRLVRRVELTSMPAGRVSFETPAAELAAGPYFARLVYGGKSLIRNVMLVK
ncbi:MAG: hypothetical protein ACM3U1_07105 [Chloroflexota bacterium]